MKKNKFKVNCKKHNREEIYTLGDLIMGRATTKNGEGGIFENWRQYTGLHDKNGKEIYEGDIVNDLYSEDELVKPSYYTIGVIKYIEDMSGFFMVSSKNCISSIIDVEVIGNIYDNPELLERSSNGD